MAPYTDDHIDKAISEHQHGASIRKAAEAWGVPESTLRRRLKGGLTRTTAHAFEQRLSPQQETHLSSWIQVQEALGYAPTHANVRALASRILRQGGDHEKLGNNWMEGFLSRNPVKTKRGVRIEAKRINGASPEAINNFFNLLETVTHIPPSRIYNTDKCGVMEGEGANGLVVGSSELTSKATYLKGNQGRTWTTLIECISGSGKRLSPLIVFKGKSVQVQWFAKEFDEPTWFFTASDNGWTSNAIAVEWLEKLFLPQTRPEDESEARLLVVDGHGSHTSDDFMWICYANNVHLLFLPAHASHVLQPLDLGVFSSLKAAYRKHISMLAEINDSAPVGKLNFLRCYQKARNDAITAKNIKSGFRATGISPRNRHIPLKSRQVVDPLHPLTPEPPHPEPVGPATPKRGADIIQFLRKAENSPGTRLKIRRVAGLVNAQLAELGILGQRKRDLEEQMVASVQQKRRKVKQHDPNGKFVTMADVVASRDGVVAVEIEVEADSEPDEAEPPRRSGRARRPTRKAVEAESDEEED